MFKLDAAEYMMSICGDDGLRERSSPGKSGSIFYLSHDDRFFIKTLKKTELKVWSCRTSFNVLFEYISYFYSCKHVYLLYLLRIYCSADLCRKFLFLWCSLRNFLCIFFVLTGISLSLQRIFSLSFPWFIYIPFFLFPDINLSKNFLWTKNMWIGSLMSDLYILIDRSGVRRDYRYKRTIKWCR